MSMSAGLQAARAALAEQRAWLVGGAVRDRLLGRACPELDLDVVVESDPGPAAQAVARAAGGAACFALSEQFGAWRVVARDRSWQVDVQALRGESLAADLALRDFTVNAIAEPIEGGAPIDPLGGLADAQERRLRAVGPSAFADDPLRALRLARMAVELDLEPEGATLALARRHAGELNACAGERVFTELRRILASAQATRGMELMSDIGATAAVLPELDALRDVQQSRFHHTDVYRHTLEVLEQTVALTAAVSGQAGAGAAGPRAASLQGLGEVERAGAAALLAEPLADGMSRGEALRWGALLHDIAKPQTRRVQPPDDRVTFLGHDSMGAEVAREVLERMRASERLCAHVAALVRHHLRLGFLVHEPQPLSRRTVYAYLRACAPVQADVTLLSVADRLATRGERAQDAIDAHLRLAWPLLGDALRWHEHGPPPPLLRGDELARELEMTPGPALGELVEALAQARFAGEVRTRDDALAFARRWQRNRASK
jgi:poly(A) polymerase